MEENRVAIQECSPGWSDSVTPGMCVVIIRGIGASDSVAFYTTAGIFERFGRPPLQIHGCRQPFSVGSVEASPRPHPRLLSEIATRFCDTPLFEPHCTARASSVGCAGPELSGTMNEPSPDYLLRHFVDKESPTIFFSQSSIAMRTTRDCAIRRLAFLHGLQEH